ncbi:MAG: hypothetical protein IT439_10365 [Phycisphaerales bacterium]|nr:hypothetical protein [Phycisphaerales bacterium]
MTLHRRLVPASLAALAGSAIAQPVLDGRLAGDEDCYGSILWHQTASTGFGDNHPDNVPPAGDADTATHGVELCIPLSALGLSGGTFNLAGWVTSGAHDFMSNQVIGGLPNRSNLGGAPVLFGDIPLQQWISVNAATVGTAPVVDGAPDAIYGSNQANWKQNNFTQFGDSQDGTPVGGGGSEIDYVRAVVNGGNLYLFIAGNLEANGNGLNLFFDTGAGGQNSLLFNNASFTNPINPDQLDVLNVQNGTTFDAGMEADYCVFIAGRDTDPGDPAVFETAAVLASLPTSGGGTATFLGRGTYGSVGGDLTGADGGAPVVKMSIDNSNVAGISGNPPVTIPSEAFSVGSEIDGVYGYVDVDANKLYLLVTGNLQTNYNKVTFFIDAGAGGQNTMMDSTGAVDIDFGGLARMGPGVNGPGLTFEPDFFADYWLAMGSGGTNPDVFSNAAVLRTNGKLTLAGVSLDYGCYDGGDRNSPDNHPVVYNGTQLDGQDGTRPNIYSQYAPRASADALIAEIDDPNGDPLNPVPPAPGLTQIYLDNSNIAGVTGDSADGADQVTTGWEICIDLDEVGYDGSVVKLAGAVTNGGYDYWSNQLIGGLEFGTGNLGEVQAINFASLPGVQHVEIPVRTCGGGCPADLTGSSDPNDPAYGVPDGMVDASDFFYYLDQFVALNLAVADLTGSSDPNDPTYGQPDGDADADDFFYYLDQFVTPCP